MLGLALLQRKEYGEGVKALEKVFFFFLKVFFFNYIFTFANNHENSYKL